MSRFIEAILDSDYSDNEIKLKAWSKSAEISIKKISPFYADSKVYQVLVGEKGVAETPSLEFALAVADEEVRKMHK